MIRLGRLLIMFCALFTVRVLAAPGDILFQEDFNDTADLTADWTIDTSTMRINGVTGNAAPSLSFEGRRSARSATSIAGRINANVPGVRVSFWVRRGFDTQSRNCIAPGNCSEYPENGENFQAEYLNDSGSWIAFANYTGGGSSGQVFTFNQNLPDDALHANLQLRFTHLGGNTDQAGWDFWHLDNIVVTETLPPPPPTVPAPRAEWRMDELSWEGTAGEVADSSGNGYSGTAFGTSTTSGFICNAGDFSPTGTTDYISVDRGAMNGLTDFTVSTWVQTTNNRSQGILSGSSGSQHNELIMWWTNQNFFLPFLKGSSSGGSIRARINNGNWRHLVWTRSGSQNCLYVDGAVQGCVSRSAAALNIASGGLIIAQEQDSLGGRFDRNQDWEGSIDELLIFDGAFSAQQVDLLYDRQRAGNNWDGSTRSCPGVSALDYYSITAATTAVSCEPLDVVIQARDASDDLFVVGSDRVINLSTSTGRGDWSGPGITNGAANDGQATLLIAAGTSGVDPLNPIQLRHGDLNGASSEQVSINVQDGGLSESAAQDPLITFSLSGLRFVDGSNTSLILTQVAGVNSANTFIQAIQVDADAANPATAPCVASYPSGATVTLQMAGECQNPSTCQLAGMTINGQTIGVANSNGEAGVSSGLANVDVTFGADAIAPITINYEDVGAIQLHAQESGNFLSGASNSFVVRPYQFAVTTVGNGTGTINPGSTTTTAVGNGFMAAGNPFRLVVQAQNAQGNITPNYGNEAVPESVSVPAAPTLVYPTGTGVTDGTLTNNTAFLATATAGEFENTTIRWNEVGTFTLRPDVADGDYLGTGLGASVPLDSGNIGRFYPAGFAVAGNTTAGYSCGGFAYLSEPAIAIDYTLQAVNASGAVVSNYDNTDAGYSTDATHMGVVSYHGENANNGTDLGSRFSDGTTQTWDNGLYQLNSTQAQFDRANASTIDGPFNSLQLSLSVTDADSSNLITASRNQDPTNSGTDFTAAIGYDGATFNPLILRYGRAIIENASGPETAPLPVNFGVQQWNGVDFETATTDACTSIAFSDISFDTNNPISNPQAVTVGGSTSNGTLNASGASVISAAGNFGLNFSAPNDTGQFPVSVDLTNYPWLRFDWNQDGNNDNDTSLPNAIINFGSYRGHDRVIYWRERF